MWLSWQPKARIDLSRQKTITDLLCMLDSDEQSLPFGWLVSTELCKATFPRANLFDLQQRRFGSENIDKDDNLHGQMYLLRFAV